MFQSSREGVNQIDIWRDWIIQEHWENEKRILERSKSLHLSHNDTTEKLTCNAQALTRHTKVLEQLKRTSLSMCSVQITSFEGKIPYVVKLHFSFSFSHLAEIIFAKKFRFVELSYWKYTFMAMFVINCVFLLLQPYLTIFKDSLLQLF